MQYYALTDENGGIIAFYNDEIHEEIPDGAVPITEEEWQTCVSNPGKYIIMDGTLVEAPPPVEDNTPKPPSFEERLNAVEQALIDLMMEGGV